MLLARAAVAAMRLSLSRAASATSPSASAASQSAPPMALLRKASWKHSSILLPRRRIGSSSSASAAAASANNDGLEPPDVRKLAKMAQLEVTDEEVADWEPKIRKIVSWFDQLQAVDLEAEEEKERQAEAKKGGAGKTQATAAEFFSLRADEVSQFGGDPTDALREAPEKEGDFLKVPRIM